MKNGVSSRSDIAEETVNLKTAMRLHRDIRAGKLEKQVRLRSSDVQLAVFFLGFLQAFSRIASILLILPLQMLEKHIYAFMSCM